MGFEKAPVRGGRHSELCSASEKESQATHRHTHSQGLRPPTADRWTPADRRVWLVWGSGGSSVRRSGGRGWAPWAPLWSSLGWGGRQRLSNGSTFFDVFNLALITAGVAIIVDYSIPDYRQYAAGGRPSTSCWNCGQSPALSARMGWCGGPRDRV